MKEFKTEKHERAFYELQCEYFNRYMEIIMGESYDPNHCFCPLPVTFERITELIKVENEWTLVKRLFSENRVDITNLDSEKILKMI